MPQVNVQGVGKINFPDTMTPEQIQQAIETDILPQAKSQPVSFEQASASLDATARPGGQLDVGPDQELIPAQGAFNSPNFRPPQVVTAPLPADESRFGTALLSEIPEDQGTRLRILAEQIFPGDPKGIERVGIRRGKPVYVNDDGKLQYVSGPLARLGAAATAASPEILGSIAGSFVGSPAAGPAIGGIIGRGAKRTASALLLDEPVTPAGVATELAIEGGLNAIGGKGGQLATKILDRGKFIDPRAYNRAALRQAEQLIRDVKAKTGIDLDLAQATGNRYLLELRDYVAKYPGKTADVFQLRDELAAGQFDAATNRVIDLVAQPVARGIAGNNAINAAKGVVSASQKAVSAQVRPLYDAAYRAVPEVTDPNVLGFLKLPYFEQAFKKGQVIAQLDEVALPPGAAPDLRSLDLTKQQLDDVIANLEAKGATNEARALRAKKNEFVELLDNYPNSQYQAARQAYAQAYKAEVEPLENGLVGVLARMSPQNAETAARVFNDPRLQPEAIALLKSSLSRLNPDAYKGLVREYLAREYDNAVRTTQGAENVNQAGKLYQRLFGSPDRQKKLKALLPPDAYDLAKDVFVAAEKLAKTPLGQNRIAGSATESRGRIADSLGDRLSPVLDLFTTSRQSVREASRGLAREKGVDMIADALTDPAKRNLLKQAVRIKDSTRQRIVLSSILAGQSAGGAVKDLTENAAPQRRPRLDGRPGVAQ